MGCMRHHALVVTASSEERATVAHAKAAEIFASFGELVSPLLKSPVNSYWSFFVAPDGSKEGWGTSEDGDQARNALVEWLQPQAGYIHWVEVQYGDDDLETRVTRDSDQHRREHPEEYE